MLLQNQVIEVVRAALEDSFAYSEDVVTSGDGLEGVIAHIAAGFLNHITLCLIERPTYQIGDSLSYYDYLHLILDAQRSIGCEIRFPDPHGVSAFAHNLELQLVGFDKASLLDGAI